MTKQAFQLGPGQKGDQLIQEIWGGGRESHNSLTPLVVGSFPLNPDDYSLANSSVTFEFVVMAANGTTPLTTHVELYNLTDGETVTSSVISIVDTTIPAKQVAALTVGSNAGDLKTGAEKVYECRIYLNADPSDERAETIELYKAEVRAKFTIQ